MGYFKSLATKMNSISFCTDVILFIACILSTTAIVSGIDAKENKTSQIKMVHVLYRHGDRAPVTIYPNDPYKDKVDVYWPEGLGQLSKKGKSMEYALGMFLRNRYDSFISKTFDPEEIRIESTDYDRTLMSAQCVLASFYYPDNATKFNKNLPWMPSPIHTAPSGADKLINVDASCPRISKELAKMQALPEVKNFIEKHRELLDFLSKHAGEKIDTVMQVGFLFDTLKIERLTNLTLPDWAIERYEEMRLFEDFSFTMSALTHELKRLRGGPLVRLMTENMHRKSHGELPDRKMLMFSAHDSTVAIVLNTLGVFNNISPPYAATVLVELYEIDGKHFVKIFYQNDTTMTNPPHALAIPGCTETCPLEHWSSLLDSVIPKDWDDECYRPDPVRDHYYIVGLTGLSSVFGILLLVVTGSFLYRRRTRRSGSGEHEPLTNVVVKPVYGSVTGIDRNGFSCIEFSSKPRCI